MRSLPGLLILSLPFLIQAETWPYNRVLGQQKKSGKYIPDKTSPEFSGNAENLFVNWLRSVVENSPNDTHLSQTFSDGTISSKAKSIHDLLDEFDLPAPETGNQTGSPILAPSIPLPERDTADLFSNLGFPLDEECLANKKSWWYRTYNGSCNWLKRGESDIGGVGEAKARDYNQHYYADGISKPREGPNARAVSNAFFKRKQALYYEHTPLLLGLIEVSLRDSGTCQTWANVYPSLSCMTFHTREIAQMNS